MQMQPRVPIGALNRAGRRRNKLPFTLWGVVDIRKNQIMAVSTWTAATQFVASHEPRGRMRGKVDNPYRVQMFDMRDPNTFGTPTKKPVDVVEKESNIPPQSESTSEAQ